MFWHHQNFSTSEFSREKKLQKSLHSFTTSFDFEEIQLSEFLGPDLTFALFDLFANNLRTILDWSCSALVHNWELSLFTGKLC